MTSQEILSRASSRLGIDRPNPMQEATAGLTVPLRLLLLAPTGSGKTLAFAIPFIRSVAASKAEGIKGILMAPTRELVLQIFECIRPLATPEFKTVALYGGHDMRTEVNALYGNPDIVIATPGRLLDHIRRKHLWPGNVDTLAIDEYDKALELGFQEDMKAITSKMRNLRTLILTSATKSVEIPDFINTKGIKTLDFLGEDNTPEPDIRIFKVESPETDKLDTLIALLKDLGEERSIVFVNHREAAERVYNHLAKAGFPVGLYHGGLEQADRDQALIVFANGTTRTLVSTDLGSRGLDIDNVGAIVHYHIPPTAENWTHRNGRTARMGASGSVYIIESDADRIPEYVVTDETYSPTGSGAIVPSPTGTLYINAGKKEKISRGDVAGFLMKQGGLTSAEVGKIDVRDHCTYVAVPNSKIRTTIEALGASKLKNTRVRVSRLKK